MATSPNRSVKAKENEGNDLMKRVAKRGCSLFGGTKLSFDGTKQWFGGSKQWFAGTKRNECKAFASAFAAFWRHFLVRSKLVFRLKCVENNVCRRPLVPYFLHKKNGLTVSEFSRSKKSRFAALFFRKLTCKQTLCALLLKAS